MLKTKKVNKKGFMLVETLIVSVFILAIFSLLFTNITPLIGEYERLKNYDTVESTYISYWGRTIALKGLPDSIYDDVKSVGFKDISDCSLYTNNDSIYLCSAYKAVNNVDKIYLTSYSLSKFKEEVSDNNSYKRDLKEYINYLPTYDKNTLKTPLTGYYRVVVEYVSNGVHNYGNIEARKEVVSNDEP